MSNLNKKEKKEKSSTIYTPVELSKYIYEIITDKYDFNTIFDPCIGKGGMTKYYRENGKYIIGSDIDNVGSEYCDIFYHQNIKELNINCEKPDLIVMNPPFNGNGKGKNLLYPHLFLKTIFERFGFDIPVVMITGDNFLNNNRKYSDRLQWISDNDIKITSVMTLPLDVFDGVLFNTQVLFFNMDKLNPYYIFDIRNYKSNNLNYSNELKLVS